MDNILSYTPNTIIEFEVDTKQMVAIHSVNNLACNQFEVSGMRCTGLSSGTLDY